MIDFDNSYLLEFETFFVEIYNFIAKPNKFYQEFSNIN